MSRKEFFFKKRRFQLISGFEVIDHKNSFYCTIFDSFSPTMCNTSKISNGLKSIYLYIWYQKKSTVCLVLKMIKLRILLAIIYNMVKIINQTATCNNNSTNSHGGLG